MTPNDTSARHAQPPWNAPGEVEAALRALGDAADCDRWRAYHRVLYALGNDHAGTYFPVVLEAIPVLGDIVRDGALVALRALDVLVDLLGSFAPEAGFEEVETEQGRRPLRDALHDAARALRADVTRRREAPESDEERRLAGELVELLDG